MKNELGLKIIKIFSLDKKLLRFSAQKKLAKKISILYGGLENEKMLFKNYIARKIENVLIVAVALLILLFVLWMNPQEKQEFKNNIIERDSYAGEEKRVYLTAKSEGME